MADIWNFLTVSENRQVLSWLGGGLVVVCGGLWSLLKARLGRSRGGGPSGDTTTSTTPVPDDQGGPATEGNVNIDNRSGLPPWHLLLLVLAFLGALIIVVSQVGNQVSVNNGCATGGEVSNSTINC